MLEFIYYLMERLDGERGGRVLLPYFLAQRVKMICLRGIK